MSSEKESSNQLANTDSHDTMYLPQQNYGPNPAPSLPLRALNRDREIQDSPRFPPAPVISNVWPSASGNRQGIPTRVSHHAVSCSVVYSYFYNSKQYICNILLSLLNLFMQYYVKHLYMNFGLFIIFFLF